MLFNLILKDILIQKRMVLFSAAYVLVILFSFQSLGAAMFSAGIVAMVYVLSLSACAYDDKNKADIMLNSLPLKRNHIVLARYLSIFVFVAMGIVEYMIIQFIINVFGLPVKVYSITIEGLLGTLFAVALNCCIYFPFYFKVGYIKARVVNFILFFGIFFALGPISAAIAKNSSASFVKDILVYLSKMLDAYIAIGMVLVIFFMFAISYIVSMKFYSSRDFY